jgi:hypothetical protein
VVTAAVTGSPVALNGDGSTHSSLSPGCPSAACKPIPPYYGGDSLTIGLTGQAAIGDLTGDGTPDYVASNAGASTLTGALGGPPAALPQTYEKAWDVSSGAVLPNFPQLQDGFPFYVAPIVAGLDSSSNRAVIDANDSGWIHAYEPGGGESPGFPKFVGQWPSFSGVIGDPKLDGKLRLAYGTREGSLFVWRVGGSPARNDQWWHFHHDEHNSGLYGNDTRRPAAIARIHVKRHGASATLRWQAPGDNGMSNGPVARYEVFRSRKPITTANLDRAQRVGPPPPVKPGRRQSVTIHGGGSGYIAIRSIDDAGNISALTSVHVPGR